MKTKDYIAEIQNKKVNAIYELDFVGMSV